MKAAILRCALAAALVCPIFAAAACAGETPTEAINTPAAHRLDGGVTLGSGSRTGGEAPPSNTTTAADSGSTAASGGVTLGSGS